MVSVDMTEDEPVAKEELEEIDETEEIQFEVSEDESEDIIEEDIVDDDIVEDEEVFDEGVFEEETFEDETGDESEEDVEDEKYGGFNQVEHIKYPVKRFNGQNFIEIYLPARTAIVLEEGRKRPVPKKILDAEEMARQMREAEA